MLLQQLQQSKLVKKTRDKIKPIILQTFDRDIIMEHINRCNIRKILPHSRLCPLCNSPFDLGSVCCVHGRLDTYALFEIIFLNLISIEDNPFDVIKWFFKITVQDNTWNTDIDIPEYCYSINDLAEYVYRTPVCVKRLVWKHVPELNNVHFKYLTIHQANKFLKHVKRIIKR